MITILNNSEQFAYIKRPKQALERGAVEINIIIIIIIRKPKAKAPCSRHRQVARRACERIQHAAATFSQTLDQSSPCGLK